MTDADVDRLVSALTGAAWKGDRSQWDAVAASLPEAVVLACNQALRLLPAPDSVALDADGEPMTVLRTSFGFTPGADDFEAQAAAAYDLGLQVLLDNYLDDTGRAQCRFRLLSGEAEIAPGTETSVWPKHEKSVLSEQRVFSPSELHDVLNDRRWKTCRARAHWVWIADRGPDQTADDYTSDAVWVVEYFDEGVPDNPAPGGPEEWESFVVGGWNPWPMTARTRFVLWQALAELQTTLDLGLDGWQHDSVVPDDNDFMHDFPPLVRFEPRAWWEALQESCSRLVEAMRTGERWNPRTPGEEAVIYVACRAGWVESAQDYIEDRPSLRRQFADLPEGKDRGPEDVHDDSEGGADYAWNEVPAALAGDLDIALLWMPAADGIGAPDDLVNREQGIGDYRAESWHQPFARYEDNPDAPSALH
ncbi:hypothetical protein ACP3TD_11525 [Pseudarthrobacter sp. 1G09]|uniref:hypothetical protein n=1 Tax=Pseudarthrobacter sp. 1G09 TaxID=3416178 RepID=UPI003CF68885